MRSPIRHLIALAKTALTGEQRERLSALAIDDAGCGYDAFGLNRDWLALGLFFSAGLYRAWFRVTSHHSERIPREGAAILAANHGGILPFDALMLWADVMRRAPRPRVPRPVADNFVPLLPFVGTLFARHGVVAGARGNVHRLLERGELLMIFPEGTVGIGKPRSQRYRLQDWRVGHVEMAIRHRAPVLPVAIIGPDEQFPLVVRLPVHAFGAPFLPLSLLPFPLPVHYRIHYGEPIALHEQHPPSDADHPAALREAAEQVKRAEQRLIDEARAEDRRVFT